MYMSHFTFILTAEAKNADVITFGVSVLPPIPNCEAGHVQPMFLSATPSHGAVLHATVDETFQLFAQAEARHSTYFF